MSFILRYGDYSNAHRSLLFWLLQNVRECDINIRSSAANVGKGTPLLTKSGYTIYVIHLVILLSLVIELSLMNIYQIHGVLI